MWITFSSGKWRWGIQFSKEGERTIEECKLKVIYMFPHSASGNVQDGSEQNFDVSQVNFVQIRVFIVYSIKILLKSNFFLYFF